jgi:predicted permease
MVLGEGTWRRLFGADPTVIGRTLQFEGFDARIIGVMPETFQIPAPRIAFWSATDFAARRDDAAMYQNARYFAGIARLAPGMSLQQANLALQQQSNANAARWPGSHAGKQLYATPMLERVVPPSLLPVLHALTLLGVLVLLIACGNAINLLVARGLNRLGDLAVHQAIGASVASVSRLLLLEAALLVGLAWLLGLLLAWLGLTLWIGLGDSGLPRSEDIAISLPVLAFALACGALALLLVGCLPLLPLRRGLRDLRLRGRAADAARHGFAGWLLRLLPTAGVALSSAALATAAVLLLSTQRLAALDLGYAADELAAVHVFRNVESSAQGQAQLRQFGHELLDAARSSGARSHMLINSAPLSGVGYLPVNIEVVGRSEAPPTQPVLRAVAGDVQGTLSLVMLEGRALNAQDRAGSAPVAMVNRSFAQQLFAGGAALGQRIRVPPYGISGAMLEVEIVGVFADQRTRQASADPQPEIWLPFDQYPVNSLVLLARTRAGMPAAALVKPLQQAFWQLDPRQGIYRAYTLSSEVDAALATPRFFARNAGSFALLALVLGTLGIYAVVAFDLTQRRRDLALRAALGANARALGSWILRRGVYTLGLGLLIGGGIGWLLIGLVRSQLFGVAEEGAGALLIAGTLVSLATLSVCLWLARQAGRTDPMLALRHD